MSAVTNNLPDVSIDLIEVDLGYFHVKQIIETLLHRQKNLAIIIVQKRKI